MSQKSRIKKGFDKKMAIKVGMVSLGCSKNLVDAEQALYDLREKGFELVADAALAEVVIINTCGFIESAKQEAIETILEFCTLKEEGRIKGVIVTGCMAQRYKEEIMKEIPEIDGVIGLGGYEKLHTVIEKAVKGEKECAFGEIESLDIDRKRIVSTSPTFAYVKIAEGCSNRCTYCAIPSIRGNFRSRTLESIVSEAKWLAKHGIKELILIAQDTTRYGEDLYGKGSLPQLLTELCKIEELVWVRVLYCYPERIDDELIDVIAKEEKIANYLDIPIQHCNSEVLKRMNRRGNKEYLVNLFAKLREKIEGIVIRSTLIVGFPGETNEQFEELCEFVKEVKIDRLGCFPYSAEEGTPAATFPDQIEEEVKNRRAEVIMETQLLITEEVNQNKVGNVVTCVVEGFDEFAECFFGRSYADTPEIDGKIFFSAERSLTLGEFVDVEIVDVLDYDLIGVVVEE